MDQNKKPLLLLIDDEPDILEVLSLMISSFGFEVATAENVTKAIKSIDSLDITMCLTDMNLPDGLGVDVIEHISKRKPNVPIAVFTAHGNIELAVKCLQMGAFDFISKPVKSNDLKKLLEQGVKSSKSSTNTKKKSTIVLDGTSDAIKTVRKQIYKIAKSQATVHISGPSGSGKELAAKLIHQQGHRSEGPFIAINCGAIPADLVESEFFGHTKGSFSGATSDTKGLFRAAEGGTLFLDEVADLPIEMQVKLLRTIQEKKVRPVGATTEYDIDVRLISATHKNLENLVQENEFREDLYFRINVIPLKMPSLSQRPEDITIISEVLLKKINNKNSQQASLSSCAVDALQNHKFPGNVRELENILERACAFADNGVITENSLMLNDTSHNTQNETQRKDSSSSFKIGEDNINDFLEQAEKEAILAALEKTKGNKTKAAELLGISFRALRHKLTKIDTSQ